MSLAKRIEEVFTPGMRAPIVLPHDTPELQLLQRVRDEAHRFAITHHRTRRDKAMTESVLDGLPGHRPDPQARSAEALRLAGSRAATPRARSSRRCPGCRRRSPASSTRTCAWRGSAPQTGNASCSTPFVPSRFVTVRPTSVIPFASTIGIAAARRPRAAAAIASGSAVEWGRVAERVARV